MSDVARGDEAACTRLVTAHASAVFGVALAVAGDRSLAEDISQKAFEKAWRRASTFDAGRGSVRAWLVTITRRVAIDELRARRLTPLAGDDLARLLPAATDDPAESATAETERDRVVVALGRLPEVQRRAIILTAIGGLTVKEVALREGIPLGTAKTRVRLGLRRLRALLSGTEEGST